MQSDLAPKIIKIVKANEQVNYNAVWLVVLLYILVFWLVISIWVVNDAQKRYGTRKMAILWFLLVFILNIPFLILYLALRPDPLWDELEKEVNGHHDIHLPVVQLQDGRRVVISLETRSAEEMPQIPAVSGYQPQKHIPAQSRAKLLLKSQPHSAPLEPDEISGWQEAESLNSADQI